MYCDIPQCKRCCFCVPLRHGIIIFGYLNLILTLLAMSLISHHLLTMNPGRTNKTVIGIHHGVIIFYHAALPLVLYSIDAIFNLVLIVGAHMKKDLILKIYFWYGVAMTASSIIAIFAKLNYTRFFMQELLIMLCGLVVHVYLILLIWWEIKKLHNGEKFRFINRTTVLHEMMDSNMVQEATTENV